MRDVRRIEVDINIKTYGRKYVDEHFNPKETKEETLLGEDKVNGLTLAGAIIKLTHYLGE